MASKFVVYGLHRTHFNTEPVTKLYALNTVCHLEFLHNHKFVWFQVGVYKFSKILGPISKFRTPEG